jgi:hypothetical protein
VGSTLGSNRTPAAAPIAAGATGTASTRSTWRDEHRLWRLLTLAPLVDHLKLAGILPDAARPNHRAFSFGWHDGLDRPGPASVDSASGTNPIPLGATNAAAVTESGAQLTGLKPGRQAISAPAELGNPGGASRRAADGGAAAAGLRRRRSGAAAPRLTGTRFRGTPAVSALPGPTARPVRARDARCRLAAQCALRLPCRWDPRARARRLGEGLPCTERRRRKSPPPPPTRPDGTQTIRPVEVGPSNLGRRE